MSHLFVGVRHPNSSFWEKSGVLQTGTRPHQPFIVMIPGQVLVMSDIAEVLAEADGERRFDDSAEVLWQWPGKWRSDFFQFTVGDLREQING